MYGCWGLKFQTIDEFTSALKFTVTIRSLTAFILAILSPASSRKAWPPLPVLYKEIFFTIQ